MTTRQEFDEVLERIYRKTDESELPDGAVHAWDFRRIAYDVAVEDKWDDHIERPFVDHAPRHLKRRVLEILEEMREDPSTIHDYYEQSCDYRDDVAT